MSIVNLGNADADYFKKYERKFIQLNRETVLLLHLFTKDKDHSFEDIWLHDLTGVHKTYFACLKESARQLIKQLEGHDCRMFLEALRDVCNEEIKADLERIKKYENMRNQ